MTAPTMGSPVAYEFEERNEKEASFKQEALTPSTVAATDMSSQVQSPRVAPAEEVKAPAAYENPRNGVLAETRRQSTLRQQRMSLQQYTEANWHASAEKKLHKARVLRHMADGQLMRTPEEAMTGINRLNQATDYMRANARKKIESAESFTRALWTTVTSTEDLIRLLGHSIFQLSRALAGSRTPLELVEECLEMRSQRPHQEQVLDNFQICLEHERRILLDARQVYKDHFEASQTVLADLDEAKRRLREDMQRKRHATRLDLLVLRGPEAHGHEAQILPQVTALRHGEASPKLGDQVPYGSQGQQADTQTAQWVDTTEQLLADVAHLQSHAGKMNYANEELVKEQRSLCEEARTHTVAAMRKRIEEEIELRKKLEEELSQTNFKVKKLELALEETERQCDMYNVPLAQLDKNFTLRERRATAERIRDSVHIAQEEVFTTINENVKVLQKQYQNKKELHTQLFALREEMAEDLKNKVSALTIDVACSRISIRPHSARIGARRRPQSASLQRSAGQSTPPMDAIHKPHFRKKMQRFAQTAGFAREAGGSATVEVVFGPGSPGWG